MRLLIAHDGSPQSDAVLRDLPRCGLPEEGEAIVLSVADAWIAIEGSAAPAFSGAVAGVGSDVLRAALVEADRISQRGRDLAAAVLTGWRVDSSAVAGSPSWEIIRKADEWRPDLVIVGATGTSILERLIFGTTTSQVLEHAGGPVRVSRPRAGGTGPIRLLLGCDGSEQSTLVAAHVSARKWPAGTIVRIVTALNDQLFGALDADAGRGESEIRRQAAALAESLAPTLRAAGLTVETLVKDGDPKTLLVEEAEAWKADCILVGARGRTGLARFLLGSVALATSSRARCSVEIVRPVR